ncbi:MAG: flagellar M-ring protein FliF C-terminal domain-containing protein [Phycisphaeraceae bacterium]
MQFVRNSWAQIRVLFGNLTVAERLLVATLVALAGVIIFVVLQYAASPEMVAISAFAGERQGEVVDRLNAAGIKTQITNGQVMVPADKQIDALVVLQRSDLMTANTAAAFDSLVLNQNPWTSNEQNKQAFLLAKQKVLAAIVSKMVGVRGADVMVSMPEDRGFGRRTVRPSASVNVVMQAPRKVDKAMVEAVAGLVAGAVAEMTPQDVVVIDANAGRQFTVKSGSDAFAAEAMEFVQKLETYHREKINEVLSYIPGVIVAVNVQTDPTVHRTVSEREYERNQPLRSERSVETERRDTAMAGAPGARSNTGVDIESGGGAGSSDKSSETLTEFLDTKITKDVQTVESGHNVQQINVTVNVPRSFFARIYTQGKADAKEPDDTALAPLVTQQLAQIESQVEPLIAATGKGVVKAHMIPDHTMFMPVSAEAGGPASTLAVMVGSKWMIPTVLGVLALGLMVMMARKATQVPPMPTAQEMAGVPPMLPVEDDLVGEVESGDATMAGVELDEDEMRHRKIAEQIGEMIRGNPTEAATLVRKWVRTEE